MGVSEFVIRFIDWVKRSRRGSVTNYRMGFCQTNFWGIWFWVVSESIKISKKLIQNKNKLFEFKNSYSKPYPKI
jgi:hypothetical protein